MINRICNHNGAIKFIVLIMLSNRIQQGSMSLRCRMQPFVVDWQYFYVFGTQLSFSWFQWGVVKKIFFDSQHSQIEVNCGFAL